MTSTNLTTSQAPTSEAETPPAGEELRVCRDCCQFKPLTQFRRRIRGQEERTFQCRQCHTSAERHRRDHKRAIRTGRQMQSLATEMKRKGRSTKRLEALLELSIVSAGGFEALLRNWHGVFEQCLASGKPTPRLVAFYEGIFGLMNKSVRHQ